MSWRPGSAPWRFWQRRRLPHRNSRRPSTEFEIKTTIRGEAGAPPHYAVPDFIALTSDKETADAARLIAAVLWDDLSFEREFDMIPRDTYRPSSRRRRPRPSRSIGGASSAPTASSRARSKRTGNTFQVEMRLFNVRARAVALGRVYDNVALRNPRAVVAHDLG